MTNIVTYHLPSNQPEFAMKKTFIFFYVHDSNSAVELAKRERVNRHNAYVRDASRWYPAEAENADEIVIMPDVPAHYRKPIEETYSRRVRPFDEYKPPEATERVIEGAMHRDTTSTATAAEQVKVSTPSDVELMTRKELRQYAEAQRIPLDPKMDRRDDLIAAIKGAERVRL